VGGKKPLKIADSAYPVVYSISGIPLDFPGVALTFFILLGLPIG
jgi:hypothetical protein